MTTIFYWEKEDAKRIYVVAFWRREEEMKLYFAGSGGFRWDRNELEQLRKMLKNGNCRRLISFFYYNPDKPRDDYSGNVIRAIKRLKEEMNES